MLKLWCAAFSAAHTQHIKEHCLSYGLLRYVEQYKSNERLRDQEGRKRKKCHACAGRRLCWGLGIHGHKLGHLNPALCLMVYWFSKPLHM